MVQGYSSVLQLRRPVETQSETFSIAYLEHISKTEKGTTSQDIQYTCDMTCTDNSLGKLHIDTRNVGVQQ